METETFYIYELTFISGGFDLVKLSAHRAGLPGNVISFYIVPLYPACLPTAGKAGLAGHLPVKPIT